jgi:hypothetical protein
MPTECEICHEDYEQASDSPYNICPECWQEQRQHYTGADEPPPTPEELEQERAYYAYLDSVYGVRAPDPVDAAADDDDDDQGYCGPTCGRFGNW